MEYRFLGNSGLKVSALSFGAWVTFGPQMNEDKAAECMHAAWEAGVNFFDNAEVYADGVAEQIMGAVLSKSGWKRSDFVVSTKIFWAGEGPNDRGLSRKHVIEGTDAALARLQLDYRAGPGDQRQACAVMDPILVSNRRQPVDASVREHHLAIGARRHVDVGARRPQLHQGEPRLSGQALTYEEDHHFLVGEDEAAEDEDQGTDHGQHGQ